jgi:hypothetical protein
LLPGLARAACSSDRTFESRTGDCSDFDSKICLRRFAGIDHPKLRAQPGFRPGGRAAGLRWRTMCTGRTRLCPPETIGSRTSTHGLGVLYLSKVSGPRCGLLLVVPEADEANPKDRSILVLESTPSRAYVSAMQLPEFGMTLRFNVPSSRTEKQTAKAGATPLGMAQ